MADIKWGELGFAYTKTVKNVRSEWKDGKWGTPYSTDSEHINMHMAATCLHYGQEIFEGLKAFRGKDGKVRLFRVEENAKRMIDSANYLRMQYPSVDLFRDMVVEAIRLNAEFIPPYGTGASLYIRPLLIGTGAQVGVKPATEFMFLVFVTPVGPYFKEGFNAISVTIDRDHDRAAPLGTGHVKVGGNYAASMESGELAHKDGFANVLFLDSATHKFIDEFSAANFFGIRDGLYVTPDSHSVLPSITNKTLREIAEDLGLKVENRPIAVEELAQFTETGAVGTAAVISPVGKIYDPLTKHTYIYGDGKTAGEWSTKLYKTLQGIQYGEIEDTHGWNTVIEGI